MTERDKLRRKSADYLNTLSSDDLNEQFGIGRVSRIDRMDSIGVPVYSAVRPNGRSISITCGKGHKPFVARSGAIAEAIELYAAENPPEGYVASSSAESFNPDVIRKLPLAKNSVWNSTKAIDWDQVTGLVTQTPSWLPVDIIWLAQRTKTQFALFQSSTNGLAAGATKDDAILQGLYELIERDAMSCYEVACDRGFKMSAIFPSNIGERLRHLISKVESSSTGIQAVFYDLRSDCKVPAYACQLFPNDDSGVFAGYGCHVDPQIALERALLEAIQSRAVYIVGARDDLFRRRFIALKRREAIPERRIVAVPESPAPFMSVDLELEDVLSRLPVHMLQDLYYKELLANEHLSVVKVISLDLEPPRIGPYQPTHRALTVFEKMGSAVLG